jgi:hypothetical protein
MEVRLPREIASPREKPSLSVRQAGRDMRRKAIRCHDDKTGGWHDHNISLARRRVEAMQISQDRQVAGTVEVTCAQADLHGRPGGDFEWPGGVDQDGNVTQRRIQFAWLF